MVLAVLLPRLVNATSASSPLPDFAGSPARAQMLKASVAPFAHASLRRHYSQHGSNTFARPSISGRTGSRRVQQVLDASLRSVPTPGICTPNMFHVRNLIMSKCYNLTIMLKKQFAQIHDLHKSFTNSCFLKHSSPSPKGRSEQIKCWDQNQ